MSLSVLSSLPYVFMRFYLNIYFLTYQKKKCACVLVYPDTCLLHLTSALVSLHLGSDSTMVILMCLIGSFTLLEGVSVKLPRLLIWVKTFLLVCWYQMLSCLILLVYVHDFGLIQLILYCTYRLQFYSSWRQCYPSWVHTSREGKGCGPEPDFYVWGKGS